MSRIKKGVGNMSLEQYELEMAQWKRANDDIIYQKLSMFEGSIDRSFHSPVTIFEHLLAHMDEHRDFLLYCFSEDSVVDSAFLSHLVHVLCQYNAEGLVNLFEQFPQVKYIFQRKNGYDIVTPRGKFVFYKASKMLTKYSKVIRQCSTLDIEDSNLLVSLFASKFVSANVITCLMPQLYTGLSYESFIELEEENGVLDLCHDTFYVGDHFERLYQPKILVKKKATNVRNPLLEAAFKSQN